MSINVLIAGGGIGGLATALACARAGQYVQLFERAAAFAEIGAGIQLGPNVTRILHSWGLQRALEDVAAYPDRLQVRDAMSGKTLGTLRLGDTALARYGAPYATVHRADLHAMLAQAVMAHGCVKVQLASEIDRYEESAAGISATTVAGDRHDGDLLVGADGLYSNVRRQMLSDGPPPATAHRAYRALVAQNSLPEVLRSQCVTAWLGPHLHLVHYPVRGGEWLNVVAFIAQSGVGALGGSTVSASANEEWDQAASTTALQTALRGVCKPLDALIQAIGAWRAWPVCHRVPVQGPHEQARGRVALLGDAAHPMLPYLAQGAGMAIEDAQALGQRLQGNRDVQTALQFYAQTRWHRNASVQRRALRNAQIFHATGLLALGRNLSMRVLSERVMDLPWLYGHGQDSQG